MVTIQRKHEKGLKICPLVKEIKLSDTFYIGTWDWSYSCGYVTNDDSACHYGKRNDECPTLKKHTEDMKKMSKIKKEYDKIKV